MLSSEIIRQVKQLQIKTGRQVADVLAGQYLSVFKGVGVEFDEVRPYVPGDDVRSIDWNVTARMGLPYVKRFVEERELTVLLVVDVSASQDFGSGQRSKREAATELSALLAFSAIQNDDKIGLLLFQGGAETYIPPRKTQKHALRVVREVLARGAGAEAPEARASWRRLPAMVWARLRRLKALTQRGRSRGTNIALALEFCQKVLRRKAVLFLISDFIDEGYLKALQAANRKHDVIAVLVTDRRELEVGDVGLLTIEDAESGATAVVDTGSRSFREAVAAQGAQRLEALRGRFRASGVDFITVDATASVVEPLLAFFQQRQRRIRR